MSRKVTGFPTWAASVLKKLGYEPHAVMNQHIARWWGWYQVDNGWYAADRKDASRGDDPSRHLSLRPARMACDEWASLIMDDKTQITSDDEATTAWISERFGDFVGRSVDDLALAFALGTGAWVADFTGISDGAISPDATARITFYDAGQICPLTSDGRESVSCAFLRQALVGGRLYDQLQVHEPDQMTGTYHVRTWLFSMKNHTTPVVNDSLIADLDTLVDVPSYALVRPCLANTYEEATPLGVSIFDDAVDAIMCVDEAFDSLYWRLRICQPRVLVDEAGIARDAKTGAPDLVKTVDQRIFKTIRGSVGSTSPTTVVDPALQADETEQAINAALSVLSGKCGFGPNYFSYSRQGGLKTATEVSADNSQLFRNVRRHEQLVGAAISRVATGAYAAECALRGFDVDPALISVIWDDSIVEDTATERAVMKDDISRGLCPAYLYPMRFYGMSEEEARALVGMGADIPPEV